MTITQTIEISADRRITLEVPREVPEGKARFEYRIIPFVKKEEKPIPLLSLRGSCQGLDTMDAYFARKQADKAFEDGLIKENPYKIQEQ